MPLEAGLVNDNFTPSENNDSIDVIISNLYNEVMVNHGKILKFRREKKTDKADDLQLLNLDLQAELDCMIKSQMAYLRYLKAIGQNKNNKPSGVSSDLKNQKSSNGAIVQLVPKN